MRTLDEIQHRLTEIRIERAHPRPQLTIVLNNVGLISINSDKRRDNVVDNKAWPRRILGVPYTVDPKQSEKFRVVMR